jgi:hypothetical protein
VAALDDTPQPTVFLFGNSHIYYWNRAMQVLLKYTKCLSISENGELFPNDYHSNIKFRDAVSSNSSSYGLPVVLSLSDPFGGLSQLVTVSSAGNGLAMVQFPASMIERSALTFQLRSLGLPPGRARIAAALGNGMSIKEVAVQYQLATSTVQTEVRNISKFIKQKHLSASVGLRSITDVVTKLATIAGGSGNTP